MRAKKYDELAIKFLAKNPEAILVNLGCGLDTRFYRIDNGKLFRGISNIKMQRQLKLDSGTEFRFGVSSSTEMERWHPGIEFMEDWCYFQSDHPKLGWMRVFGHLRFMNKVQWTVHYRLNSSER